MYGIRVSTEITNMGVGFGLVRAVQADCGFPRAICPLILNWPLYLHDSVIKQRNGQFYRSLLLLLWAGIAQSV